MHIKKSISKVLLFSFLFSFLGFHGVIAAPETIVEFNFENATKRGTVSTAASFLAGNYIADAGTGTNLTTAKISAVGPFSGLVWGGGGNFQPNLSGTWETGSGSKSWRIDFSTLDYKTLTLSSKQQSSNTGPRDFKVQYNIGGGWIDVPTSNVVTANNLSTGVLNNIALPVAIENKTSVSLRWIMTSNMGVNLSLVASTGTSRIDDIIVSGVFSDMQAPVVSLVGSGTLSLEVGSSYTELGATWTDNVDGSGSILLANTGSVNTTVVAAYTLQYNHTDIAGNIGNTVTRTVNIVDTTKPVITLSGSASINVLKNVSYTDAGARWIDNYDGSGSLTASGTVNTSQTGSYILEYNHTDISGNVATQVSRTVNVVEGSTPVITLSGSALLSHEVLTSYIDAGATWTDTEDGTGSLTASGTVHTSQTGSYILKYNYTDTQGNIATQVTRTVNIVDTTKPVITLSGSASINVLKNVSYTDAGARWIDNYDGSGSLTASGTVNTSQTGSYILEYNHTDISGNVATQVSRTVNVVEVPVSVVSGGAGTYVPRDTCPNTDTSGNYYDGKCEKEKTDTANNSDITDTGIVNEEDTINDTTDSEEVLFQENNTKQTQSGAKYTLENNFSSCPLVADIKNPRYLYLNSGVFEDEDTSIYRHEILKFQHIGVVDGFSDNTFKPTQVITRSEFLKVVLRSHCYEYTLEDASQLSFADVDNTHWQARVIAKSVKLGIVTGDVNKKGVSVFRPNDIISKAEAVKILMRLSGIEASSPKNLTYSDIIVDWQGTYIRTGETLGLFDAERDNGVFNPDEGVTREEMVHLIQLLINLY